MQIVFEFHLGFYFVAEHLTCLPDFFVQKINSFQDLKDEISLLRITVPLSMFCLDCQNLNQDLGARSQRLKERLIIFEVDENRELNRG